MNESLKTSQKKYLEPEKECANRAIMEEIQTQKLKKVVEYCYNNVEYYKNKLNCCNINPEQIKSLKDIERLPFMCKKDIRENYPLGLLAVPHEKIMRIHASSGTTGKRTIVGYTKTDIQNCSRNLARFFIAFGAGSDDLLQNTFSYGLFSGGLAIQYAAEMIGMGVIPAAVGNTLNQVEFIKDIKPTIIAGTPSYALHIGETLEKQNVSLNSISLKFGAFAGEPWSNNIKKIMKNKLGIKAYDVYGLSELMPCTSFECKEESGLHINEDSFLPEVIDPKTGEALPYGQRGELVLTSLDNQAMPLIRYRTGDITSIYLDECACGRTLIKMGKPCGRIDDMLIIKGINVFPNQIETVITEMGLGHNYQLIISNNNYIDNFEVQIEYPDIIKYPSDVIIQKQKEIEEVLKMSLCISVNIRLINEGIIPRSQGKAVRVIDKRVKL